MAFKDLFKSKAERRAYAKGRRDQYNKEHPKMNWMVRIDAVTMKNGGKVDYKLKNDRNASKFRTRKEAEKAYKAAVEREKHWKSDVLKRSRVGKLNERDSGDRTYYDFKLVKINERKK